MKVIRIISNILIIRTDLYYSVKFWWWNSSNIRDTIIILFHFLFHIYNNLNKNTFSWFSRVFCYKKYSCNVKLYMMFCLERYCNMKLYTEICGVVNIFDIVNQIFTFCVELSLNDNVISFICPAFASLCFSLTPSMLYMPSNSNFINAPAPSLFEIQALSKGAMLPSMTKPHIGLFEEASEHVPPLVADATFTNVLLFSDKTKIHIVIVCV